MEHSVADHIRVVGGMQRGAVVDEKQVALCPLMAHWLSCRCMREDLIEELVRLNRVQGATSAARSCDSLPGSEVQGTRTAVTDEAEGRMPRAGPDLVWVADPARDVEQFDTFERHEKVGVGGRSSVALIEYQRVAARVRNRHSCEHGGHRRRLDVGGIGVPNAFRRCPPANVRYLEDMSGAEKRSLARSENQRAELSGEALQLGRFGDVDLMDHRESVSGNGGAYGAQVDVGDARHCAIASHQNTVGDDVLASIRSRQTWVANAAGSPPPPSIMREIILMGPNVQKRHASRR